MKFHHKRCLKKPAAELGLLLASCATVVDAEPTKHTNMVVVFQYRRVTREI